MKEEKKATLLRTHLEGSGTSAASLHGRVCKQERDSHGLTGVIKTVLCSSGRDDMKHFRSKLSVNGNVMP